MQSFVPLENDSVTIGINFLLASTSATISPNTMKTINFSVPAFFLPLISNWNFDLYK